MHQSRYIRKPWRHRIIWAFSPLSAKGFAFYLYIVFIAVLRRGSKKKFWLKDTQQTAGCKKMSLYPNWVSMRLNQQRWRMRNILLHTGQVCRHFLRKTWTCHAVLPAPLVLYLAPSFQIPGDLTLETQFHCHRCSGGWLTFLAIVCSPSYGDGNPLFQVFGAQIVEISFLRQMISTWNWTAGTEIAIKLIKLFGFGKRNLFSCRSHFVKLIYWG